MLQSKQLNKHTPGPWREKKYSLRVLAQVRNEDGGFEPFCVADCGQSLHLSSYLVPGEQGANARLIAAAPELLTATRKMLALVDNAEWTQAERLACIHGARAAVAKAEQA